MSNLVKKSTLKQLQKLEKELGKLHSRKMELYKGLDQINEKMEQLNNQRDQSLSTLLSNEQDTDTADLVATDRELEDLGKQADLQTQAINRLNESIAEKKREIVQIEQELDAEATRVWRDRYDETWNHFQEVLDQLMVAYYNAGKGSHRQLAHQVYLKILKGPEGQAAEKAPKSEYLDNGERFAIARQLQEEEAEANMIPPGPRENNDPNLARTTQPDPY